MICYFAFMFDENMYNKFCKTINSFVKENLKNSVN